MIEKNESKRNICKNCRFASGGGNGIIWCRFDQEHRDESDTCPYFIAEYKKQRQKPDCGEPGTHYDVFLYTKKHFDEEANYVHLKCISRNEVDMLISITDRQDYMEVVIRTEQGVQDD